MFFCSGALLFFCSSADGPDGVCIHVRFFGASVFLELVSQSLHCIEPNQCTTSLALRTRGSRTASRCQVRPEGSVCVPRPTFDPEPRRGRTAASCQSEACYRILRKIFSPKLPGGPCDLVSQKRNLVKSRHFFFPGAGFSVLLNVYTFSLTSFLRRRALKRGSMFSFVASTFRRASSAALSCISVPRPQNVGT